MPPATWPADETTAIERSASASSRSSLMSSSSAIPIIEVPSAAVVHCSVSSLLATIMFLEEPQSQPAETPRRSPSGGSSRSASRPVRGGDRRRLRCGRRSTRLPRRGRQSRRPQHSAALEFTHREKTASGSPCSSGLHLDTSPLTLPPAVEEGCAGFCRADVTYSRHDQ